MNGRRDVLVIGAGAAGLYAAVAAAGSGAHTTVVCAGSGATALAAADLTLCGDQMIACGYENAPETPAELGAAIQATAYGLADPIRVRRYTGEAVHLLDQLLSWGLRRPLRISSGTLLISGREILQLLVHRARDLGVEFIQDENVLGLLDGGDRVAGVLTSDGGGNIHRVTATVVVLASGGYHGLLEFTTGGHDTASVAQAWALRAGARLIDLEAIDYCPNVISEGEYRGSIAAYLVGRVISYRILDELGVDLLADIDRRLLSTEEDKLIIGQKMIEHARVGDRPDGGRFFFQAEPVPNAGLALLLAFLDVAPEDEALAKRCAEGEPIPVGLAAHYSCGGIATDCDGRTDVPGLYACGEVAGGTFGVHRVASAVMDCLIFGRAAGSAAAEEALGLEARGPNSGDEGHQPYSDRSIVRQARTIANRALALPRRGPELVQSLDELGQLAARIPRTSQYGMALDTLLIAEATVAAALVRQDSRGFHLRTENISVNPLLKGNTSATYVDGMVSVALTVRPV